MWLIGSLSWWETGTGFAFWAPARVSFSPELQDGVVPAAALLGLPAVGPLWSWRRLSGWLNPPQASALVFP